MTRILAGALVAVVASVYATVAAQQGAARPIEPFKGITATGTIEPGLFPIKATGVSTRPVREAAQQFLQSLTPDQRTRTSYPIDDEEWLKWNNVHRYARQGVSFTEMTEPQLVAVTRDG